MKDQLNYEGIESSLKELKALVRDIHKLHFAEQAELPKSQLKDKFKAEILLKAKIR